MATNFEKVKEFHKAFGLTIGETPMFRHSTLRRKLQCEEHNEYLDSEYAGDFTNTIKELADILYIAYGTAATYGVDMDKVFDAVHQSNMSKLVDGKPVKREDGKVIKGSNYKAPDIKSIIEGATLDSD
jgi:predicted HAD superfamily Cof-like phosphohydrolase